MEDMKTPVFFRVDHPEVKSLVDSFGEEITPENLDAVSQKTSDLRLDYQGYDFAMEGSRRFNQLSIDSKYIQRTFDHSQLIKKGES
jgi:hypothetical protein